jgi:hypothetical protein
MSSSLNKTTTITIEGTQIKAFRSLTITQSVHTYHHFELAFEHQQLEDQFTFDPSSKKPDWEEYQYNYQRRGGRHGQAGIQRRHRRSRAVSE